MRIETIGDATLYLGDCLEILPTLPKVPHKAPQKVMGEAQSFIVITDPPYAVSVSGSKVIGKPGKGVRRLDFFVGDSDWVAMNALVLNSVECAIALCPVVFAAWCSHRQIGFITEALESAGYSTRLLFWRKKCPPPAPPGAGFASSVECCVYGYLPGRPWNGGQYDFNVFETDSYRYGQPGKVDHPTQKPLALLNWQVKKITATTSTIIDPFMGSGTTGVACANLGRKFIGIEIEPKYFEIACERIDNAYRQQRMFA